MKAKNVAKIIEENPEAEVVFVNTHYEWYGAELPTEDCFFNKGDVLYIQTVPVRDIDKKYINRHYSLYKKDKIKLNEFPRKIYRE